MSDSNDNSSGGQSLGGNRERIPSSWARPGNAGPRIGRVGNWGGSSSTTSNRSGGPRLATLSDLNSASSSAHAGHSHANPSDEDDDDLDDENNDEGETWFTGGERSGLAVQNPENRPNAPSSDLVRELLRKAEEAGPAQPRPEGTNMRRAFAGAGHTLGSEDVESQYIPDPNAPSAQPEEASVVRRLTFWRNGFSLEDGPLLHYDDPANEETLRSIDQGRAPLELLNVSFGQPVELRIARRTDEDYQPPPKHPLRAFEGSGHRLGAPVPDFTPEIPGAFPVASGSSHAASTSTPTREPERMQTKFEVDQSKPTTSIQLRLADGTRLVCRMNLTHTVGDIRNFINASRPENLTRPYVIATTFPNRVLDDDTQTIEAAGLKSSVVVQRWA